eukprot:2600543-Pleurochrysis_carterae.AAC.1
MAELQYTFDACTLLASLGVASPTGCTGDQGRSPCQTCRLYWTAARRLASRPRAIRFSSWAKSSSGDSIGDAAFAPPAHERAWVGGRSDCEPSRVNSMSWGAQSAPFVRGVEVNRGAARLFEMRSAASMVADSAVAERAQLLALAALFGSSFFVRLVQSLCQCLPPQYRQFPNRGDHSLSKVLGRSARFGSPFLRDLSFCLRAPWSDWARKVRLSPFDSDALFCSRASSSLRTSRIAVTVGMSWPVAPDIVILTSSRVLA